MPSAMWVDHNGEPVNSSSDIAIETTRADSIAVATLTFDPLMASHGRVYRCVGSLASPALDSPLVITSDDFDLTVGKAILMVFLCKQLI